MGDLCLGAEAAVYQNIRQVTTVGYTHFERDVLAPQLKKYNIRAFKYEGYRARICDMKSYFDENMRLLEDENLEALFGGNQIYTKIRDDNPTGISTAPRPIMFWWPTAA